jgi:methyl-accepting chemotaxis protein
MGSFRLSIQKRLIFLVGTCFLLTIGSLTYTSLFMADITNKIIETRSSELLENASKQRLFVEGNAQSLNLQNYFLSAFKEVQDLARQAANTQKLMKNSELSAEALRRELITLTTERLSSNKELLSMYVTFEPNALDGADSSFMGRNDLGSNELGRFSYYLSRNSDKLTSLATPESTIKDETPGLDGTPFRTWYDCPITTGKPCLLSPYFDESSGKKTLITTIVFPIKDQNRVIGVAGLDISLERLQSLSETAASSIYDGSGSISIQTPSRIIAGDSQHPELVGTIDSESTSIKNQTAEALPNQQTINENKSAFLSVVTQSSPIPGTAPWQILLRVPNSKILAPTIALQEELSNRASTNLTIELTVGFVAAILGLMFVWLTAKGVTTPMLHVSNALKGIAAGGGDLTQRVGYQRNDELGQLSNWFNRFLDILQPLIRDIQDTAAQANRTALKSSSLATDLDTDMQKQFLEVDQVATASQELSSSATDVAKSAAHAALATRDAENSAQQGLDVITQTTGTIQVLATALEEAMSHAQSLAERSQQIGSVLQVIHSIAEQTNLLALNAAIEAARAGDSGRGFAVVADEVRNLAKHTGRSVDEIRDVIEKLQLSASNVHKAMHNGTLHVAEGVQKVNLAAQSFHSIGSAVSVINDMTLQIASAAEQQSRVAEEVSRGVSKIRDVTEALSEKSRQSYQTSQTLNDQAVKQKKLVDMFKT